MTLGSMFVIEWPAEAQVASFSMPSHPFRPVKVSTLQVSGASCAAGPMKTGENGAVQSLLHG
jgi:hypothetical protein